VDCSGLVETDVTKLFPRFRVVGSFGALKAFQKTATNFWWPKLRTEIFNYVRRTTCQRAKPDQDTRVGLHSASPSSQRMERLFIDFVCPLTRTKRGNIAILVIVDAFSKFVFQSGPEDLVANSGVLFREVGFSCLWYSGLNSD